MNNPILKMLETPNMGRLKTAMQAVRNPQAMVEQIVSQNPQAKQLLNIVKDNGNPEKMFYDACKSKGVDPESILSQMR